MGVDGREQLGGTCHWNLLGFKHGHEIVSGTLASIINLWACSVMMEKKKVHVELVPFLWSKTSDDHHLLLPFSCLPGRGAVGSPWD